MCGCQFCGGRLVVARQEAVSQCAASCWWWDTSRVQLFTRWWADEEMVLADCSRRAMAAARQIHAVRLTLMVLGLLAVDWLRVYDLWFGFVNLVICELWCVGESCVSVWLVCECGYLMCGCVRLWYVCWTVMCACETVRECACACVCIRVRSGWARPWLEFWSGFNSLARTQLKIWIFGSKSKKLGSGQLD